MRTFLEKKISLTKSNSIKTSLTSSDSYFYKGTKVSWEIIKIDRLFTVKFYRSGYTCLSRKILFNPCLF
ncbi:TPA: hypothetical protein DCX16_03165 [bacterium]|nr:hypothetical protein [bacterium]